MIADLEYENNMLSQKVAELTRMLAWFHERTRTVWSDDKFYTNTPNYEEIRRLLSGENQICEEPEAPTVD